MSILSDNELINISAGACTYTPFDLIFKIYRIIKIRWLMKKVFVN